MDKEVMEQFEIIQQIVGKGKGALNTSEVAKLLGVSCSTIDAWRKQGIGITYLKPNLKLEADKSRVLYPVIEVAKWIVRNSVKTA